MLQWLPIGDPRTPETRRIYWSGVQRNDEKYSSSVSKRHNRFRNKLSAANFTEHVWKWLFGRRWKKIKKIIPIIRPHCFTGPLRTIVKYFRATGCFRSNAGCTVNNARFVSIFDVLSISAFPHSSSNVNACLILFFFQSRKSRWNYKQTRTLISWNVPTIFCRPWTAPYDLRQFLSRNCSNYIRVLVNFNDKKNLLISC